jgi:hypothetical protein
VGSNSGDSFCLVSTGGADLSNRGEGSYLPLEWGAKEARSVALLRLLTLRGCRCLYVPNLLKSAVTFPLKEGSSGQSFLSNVIQSLGSAGLGEESGRFYPGAFAFYKPKFSGSLVSVT